MIELPLALSSAREILAIHDSLRDKESMLRPLSSLLGLFVRRGSFFTLPLPTHTSLQVCTYIHTSVHTIRIRLVSGSLGLTLVITHSRSKHPRTTSHHVQHAYTYGYSFLQFVHPIVQALVTPGSYTKSSTWRTQRFLLPIQFCHPHLLTQASFEM